MNFYFIQNFHLILINIFKLLIALKSCCVTLGMDVFYETKPLIIVNKLEDHNHRDIDDNLSVNSYALESMPMDIILKMDKTMAVLEFDHSSKMMEKCQLFDLEKEAEKADITAAGTGLPVIKSDFRTMQEAINKCRELSEKVSANHSLEPFTAANSNITENSISLFSLWRGLIPGTKWCGLGDAANNYDDLGTKRDIDVCCRAHDHCPIRLKALRYGYGLINLSLYTKSHCDCDEDFLKCLKRSSNSYATMLGNFYFNVLKVQCIKEERPVVCLEIRKNSIGKDECLRYEVSTESRMKFVTPELQY
ncbi:phospholipase A2-like isoform X2 [Oppia nitens]|uniref:phospholipase A2-like isoform X2 n=1 Tax=Oppia nitens TaxID=1686743 RepID=UPI0023DC95C1|nr:phospholipase A2-like isoform X2 [Oppia nitens]